MTTRNCGLLTWPAIVLLAAFPTIAAATEESPQWRVVWESGFESDDPAIKLEPFQRTPECARTGEFSVVAEVKEPNRAALLKIPCRQWAGHRVRLSFWVRSDAGVFCTVWGPENGVRTRVAAVSDVPAQWRRVTAEFHELSPTRDEPIEIVIPSTHGGPPGRGWIDDVRITACPAPKVPPLFDAGQGVGDLEDWPALAGDGGAGIWMAVVARPFYSATYLDPLARPEIRVYRADANGRRLVATVAPDGVKGVGRPTVICCGEQCVVAFAVERDDGWRIAWTRVIDSAVTESPRCEFITAGGTIDVEPALALLGQRICLVWESNLESHRGIYAKFLNEGEAAKPLRLSSGEATSINPAVVALQDGRMLAVWDSLREDNVDLYGAWWDGTNWGSEVRLTSDPRIERHVSLASQGSDVWMAWEAATFAQRDDGQAHVNNLVEQRVVVARLRDGVLEAPLDLFEQVSPERADWPEGSGAPVRLKRPVVACERHGELWLSVRKSLGQQAGWEAMVYRYVGKAWSGEWRLCRQEGRYYPVPLVCVGAQMVAAAQTDVVPRGAGNAAEQFRSEVILAALDAPQIATSVPVQTVPLAMPDTSFCLKDYRDRYSLALPRQSLTHAGRALQLYWGDLHEHTDISVCARDINPPLRDLYANQRDIEGLDFTAVTDHGFNHDSQSWARSAEQVRAHGDPGRFLAFLAQEWTSEIHGHRNLIHRSPHVTEFFNARATPSDPAELWEYLASQGYDFIFVPHQLADRQFNRLTDWTRVNERLQPLAEIFQARQSYEYHGCPRQSVWGDDKKGHYLQDAWAQGIVIGVIASPDHGGTMGRAGVWADALTADGLFDAFRARHTFGTSGAKIALYFASGDAIMGDVVSRAGAEPISFRTRIVTDKPLTEVVIFRNNEVVHRATPNVSEVDLQWSDPAPPDTERLWYYVRARRQDDELAWSSPIWFVRR